VNKFCRCSDRAAKIVDLLKIKNIYKEIATDSLIFFLPLAEANGN
jgi:hypothetical protein